MEMKIHITGNAGTGKTTLAKKLGNVLETPVFSLDSIVWKQGWQQTDGNERADKERVLASSNKWIIEGVSAIIREEADLIIFLDYARLSCLTRAFKRNLKYLFKSRPELPKNCPEILIIPTLVKIIWNFDIVAKPHILNTMRLKQNIIIKNDMQAINLIDSLQQNKVKLSESLKLMQP